MTKEEFLTLFFSQINKNSIDYFVYGEYRNLPKSTGNGDIDIVVCGNIDLFDSLVRTIAQKNSIVLAAFYKNPSTRFYRFITVGWGVQMDVLDNGIRYLGCEYYPYHYLKNYLIDHNSIKVLSLEKGFYVDFFKEIIHNGTAKEKYVDAFLNEYTNNKLCFDEIYNIYGKKVSSLIEKNATKNGLMQCSKLLQKLLREKVTHNQFCTILQHRCSTLLRLLKKRIGYVIVVEGSDGSGKSFIINSIIPWLNEAFHKWVFYNHLRPNWLPDIAVVLGKRKKPKDGQEVEVVSNPHAGKQSGFAMSLVRWG